MNQTHISKQKIEQVHKAVTSTIHKTTSIYKENKVLKNTCLCQNPSDSLSPQHKTVDMPTSLSLFLNSMYKSRPTPYTHPSIISKVMVELAKFDSSNLDCNRGTKKNIRK